MFCSCSNLHAIFAGNKWNVNEVTYSSNMFSLDPNLVGGAGTKFHCPLGKPMGLVKGTRKGTLNQFCAGGDAASVSRAMIRVHRV